MIPEQTKTDSVVFEFPLVFGNVVLTGFPVFRSKGLVIGIFSPQIMGNIDYA